VAPNGKLLGVVSATDVLKAQAEALARGSTWRTGCRADRSRKPLR